VRVTLAETRSRVQAVLAEYNYATPRRSERPGLVDLVFTHELNPWAVEIISGHAVNAPDTSLTGAT
jgi:hypothetical protein